MKLLLLGQQFLIRNPMISEKRLAILWWKIKNLFHQRWKEYPLEILLAVCWLLSRTIPGFNMPAHGRLYLKIQKADGQIWNYGHIGVHLITTAGKTFVAGCFDNTNEAETLKYHGYGTGTSSAAAGDTTLQTELTTQYAVDNTRPTGSQSKSANTYTTIATLSPDSGGTLAITEWGLFSANSSGTLFDRQVFSAVNVVASADSLQTTYTLTLS